MPPSIRKIFVVFVSLIAVAFLFCFIRDLRKPPMQGHLALFGAFDSLPLDADHSKSSFVQKEVEKKINGLLDEQTNEVKNSQTLASFCAKLAAAQSIKSVDTYIELLKESGATLDATRFTLKDKDGKEITDENLDISETFDVRAYYNQQLPRIEPWQGLAFDRMSLHIINVEEDSQEKYPIGPMTRGRGKPMLTVQGGQVIEDRIYVNIPVLEEEGGRSLYTYIFAESEMGWALAEYSVIFDKDLEDHPAFLF